MPEFRKDEYTNRPCFLSNRLFQRGILWYLKIREGTPEGPFVDRDMANVRLEAYVRANSLRSATMRNCNLPQIGTDRVGTGQFVGWS